MPVTTKKTVRRRRSVGVSTRPAARARSAKPAATVTLLKPSVLKPKFKIRPKVSLSKVRKANVTALRLNTITQAKASVAALKIKPVEVAGFMDETYKRVPQKKQVMFTRAVIANWKTDEDILQQSQAIANWARTGDSKRRRMVLKAFKDSGESALIVHNIGGMERKDARAMMKDYFAVGGSLADVMAWLREAGRFMRTFDTKKKGTDGLWEDAWNAVTDAGKSVVDWATAAINTVADAINAAGKSLARAISEISGWTIGKISDVLESLLRSGTRIADILQEALKKGLSVLKKFVRAMLSAGKRIRDVLFWAADQTVQVLKAVLTALGDAGKSVLAIVNDAMSSSLSVLKATVKAMLQMGKRLVDIVRAMTGKTYAAIRNLTDALLSAGKSLLAIVSDAVRVISTALADLVKALISLGKNLGEILYSTFNRLTYNYFKKLVKAALAAGRKIAEFIDAGISRGWGLLRKAARALFELGQKSADLLSAAARKASSAVREVIKGMKMAGQKAARILSVVAAYTGKYLKRMINGFYQVFRDPVGVLKRFVKAKVNTIRMVLDGMLSAGLTFARAVKEILKNVGDSFRQGFFQGLVALGKSVVDIMKEALKLTGALAGLALATLLDLLGGHRGLTTAEKREARKIFGSSIDLNRVKISEASLPADFINLVNSGKDPGERPFTTMYVINFASWKKVEMFTLIHELTHVWQGVVAGPIYMAEALHAQFTEGVAAYLVTLPALKANKGDFTKFNREAQASLVEMYYNYRFGKRQSAGNADVWRAALRPYALQVYKSPRATVRYNRVVPTMAYAIKPAMILATGR